MTLASFVYGALVELSGGRRAAATNLITFAPTLWTLSLMLTGVAIALASLLLLSLRASLPVVVLGWTTGVALATYVPLMTLCRESGLYAHVLTAEFLALTAWALVLGILLRRS